VTGDGASGLDGMNRIFEQLGLQVLERGWLSSNNIVFEGRGNSPASVVDTGYDSHSEQTVRLVEQCLRGAPLERVVNTHLHSDHCGGNAALHAAHGCEVWVPEVSLEAVRAWDGSRLTFEQTGQTCRRFAADSPLATGDSLVLGGHRWEILPAPGHDAEAVMFFQRESRVLISGDALWEDRLAIIFSAIDHIAGFAAARSVLSAIEEIDPVMVIPGHGKPFGGVAAAISASRKRLERFEAAPGRHLQYAARALTMFHMLEVRRQDREDLIDWVKGTPIFERLMERPDGALHDPQAAASSVVERLVLDGVLRNEGGIVHLVEKPPARSFG
jgi:glyoxylase-like metal-dependent hydrolase (beta-lactamase superfamily II)